MPDNINVLLVGAGYMSKEYIKVLTQKNIPFTVIGRSQKNVAETKALFPHIDIIDGGIEHFKDFSKYTHAIVAVNVAQLFPVTLTLINNGIRTILCEKPLVIHQEDLNVLNDVCKRTGAHVYAAYNRRFYASVAALKKCIEEDKGILSCHFEFTEWIHRINTSEFSEIELKRWLISNSSHVIDLVFHIIGKPKTMHTLVGGVNHIDWHTDGSIFAGSGISDKNILFTYHSNWKSAGRWSIEILTSENKYFLRPLEKLQKQKRGQLAVEEVEIDDSLDQTYKPGLYQMMTSFLKGAPKEICTLEEYTSLFESLVKIGAYST